MEHSYQWHTLNVAILLLFVIVMISRDKITNAAVNRFRIGKENSIFLQDIFLNDLILIDLNHLKPCVIGCLSHKTCLFWKNSFSIYLVLNKVRKKIIYNNKLREKKINIYINNWKYFSKYDWIFLELSTNFNRGKILLTNGKKRLYSDVFNIHCSCISG